MYFAAPCVCMFVYICLIVCDECMFANVCMCVYDIFKMNAYLQMCVYVI